MTVFHAKYSAKSNEVIEAFQKITARRLLNPMPTIAVVYAVAEPELSTLYKVGWFPTIVYTPPLSSQPSHKRSVGTHGVLQGQPEAGYSGRDHPVAAEKRGFQLLSPPPPRSPAPRRAAGTARHSMRRRRALNGSRQAVPPPHRSPDATPTRRTAHRTSWCP